MNYKPNNLTSIIKNHARQLFYLTFAAVFVISFLVQTGYANESKSSAQTSTLRANGKIAFATYGGNQFTQQDIFTINSDGSNRTRLTNSGNANFPEFSPDGNKIAFYQSGGIYLMNADGSNQTFLTSAGNIGFGRSIALTWSPDGQRIAFACEGICIVNADGSNRIVISNDRADTAPAWSPDGTKIAFTRRSLNRFLNDEIYVMDIDGSNQTRLTNNSLPDFRPVWSPDGTKLAFTRSDACNHIAGAFICFASFIFTMNATDGSNQTLLTGGFFLDGTNARDPGWSPDGTKIVFWGSRNDDENFGEIFVINASGGSRINLTNTSDVYEAYPSWGSVLSVVPQTRAAFDFDGDGKTDISVFRPSDTVWYLNQSTAGFSATHFGLSSDKITPADYDGDGKTDIAVFRDGVWFWLNSSDGSFSAFQFGLPDDIPIPADYDGDRKADITIYRPSTGTWWTIRSSNGSVLAQQFGVSEDKPVVGDYDGDGKADIAVYRPSQGVWHILQSSDNLYRAFHFGVSEDKPVVGDYDGDSRNDLAVFRPSTGVWYILRSDNGSFFGLQFGLPTDIPTPGDYDGDGVTDIAVFRPGNGFWYGLQSSNGSVSHQQFGLNGDTPTPSAFVPQ